VVEVEGAGGATWGGRGGGVGAVVEGVQLYV
jgi:hypothetical protein